MPLIEHEPPHSWRVLTFVGIPALIVTILIAAIAHQYAHAAAERYFCHASSDEPIHITGIIDHPEEHTCAIASLAGAVSTFFLALASFAFFIHHPRNIFAAAMAFVNATWRLPETLTVFIQLVLNQSSRLIVDESTALQLLHLKDTTGSIVLLCFYSIVVIFLTIIIIHDTKFVRWKWGIAFTLLGFIGSLKYLHVL